MEEEICPKCENKRVQGKKECWFCGHKWDDPIQMFKDILGIDLKDRDYSYPKPPKEKK